MHWSRCGSGLMGSRCEEDGSNTRVFMWPVKCLFPLLFLLFPHRDVKTSGAVMLMFWWEFLKPPLIGRRLTAWWWQCWIYVCFLLIDPPVRGNGKESASLILNTFFGSDPYQKSRYRSSGGNVEQEEGDREKVSDQCRWWGGWEDEAE